MGDLAVLVPSRERPHNIARLIDAMDRTCHGDTELVVGVDDDDPTLDEYLAFPDTYDFCTVVVLGGLRRQLVRWLNILSASYSKTHPILGHVGDDNLPRTPGWDIRVMKSLENHLFCFGDDLDPGRPPGSLSLTIFMRSEVVKTLGCMGPSRIQHMYVDPIWHAWGTATSMEFLPDVVLEHMHYMVAGKAPEDESYRLSTSLIPRDCAAYNDYVYDPYGLNADIEKLGGIPFTQEALAEFNRGLNIPRVWGEPVA